MSCPVTGGSHRRATFSEGSDRKVVRCLSCYKDLGVVDEGEAAAPTPEPVEVEERDVVLAPASEPVPSPHEEARRK